MNSTQQPLPPSGNQSPKQAVIYLRWISLTLLIIALILDIYAIFVKSDILHSVLTALCTFAAIPISMLQIDRGVFSFVLRTKKVGMQVFGILLLALSVVGNIYFLSSSQARNPPVTPASSFRQPTRTDVTSFANITIGQQTVVTDFLKAKWDTGDQKDGSCFPQVNTFQVIAKTSEGKFSCMLHAAIGGDIAVQVAVMITNGTVAGIVFKDNNASNPHNYYLFTIDTSAGGYYKLTKGLGNRSPSIIDTAPIDGRLLNSGNSPNILGVTVIKQNICLYINQHRLHCITDNQMYGNGTIGFYVGAPPGSATFSNLTMWEF